MSSNQHNVNMYGLSTCVHCKHARDFLETNSISFDCVYVDLLQGNERNEVLDKVKTYNARISFPTIVIDNGKAVIVGFNQAELCNALDIKK